MANSAAPSERKLDVRSKAIYALGDHTVNLSLSSLAFFYANFLTDVARIRPELAGLIPLIGRCVDAFTDPAMGRLSDVTRLPGGRRRPYFLIGMLPFGLAFAALWWPAGGGESARFAYYAFAYVFFSVSVTVLSVPYLSLMPELTSSYHERTSLNTYRAAAAIAGTMLGVTTMQALVQGFGGGPRGYAGAGACFGLWMMLPWLAVYRVTWERPDFQRPPQQDFASGLKLLLQHRTYLRLIGVFVLGRVAIDLSMAMFLFYFKYWLQRPGDFAITMGVFLLMVITALPVWLAASRRADKRTIFIFGALWWIGSQVFLLLAQPDWPRAAIFLGAAIAGVGYAAADMMPWSMISDVVDEDELRSGERREGVYFGTFTFLRKLTGAAGVAIALPILGLTGYAPEVEQNSTTLWAIRLLTAGVPAVFIALAAIVALRYPLGHRRHAEILTALEQQRRQRAG